MHDLPIQLIIFFLTTFFLELNLLLWLLLHHSDVPEVKDATNSEADYILEKVIVT